jgi:hypothetical protein
MLNIIKKEIELKINIWVRYVVYVTETRNAHKVFVGKFSWEYLLENLGVKRKVI